MERFRGINFTLSSLRLCHEKNEVVTCSNCGATLNYNSIIDKIDDPGDILKCEGCSESRFDVDHQPD